MNLSLRSPGVIFKLSRNSNDSSGFVKSTTHSQDGRQHGMAIRIGVIREMLRGLSGSTIAVASNLPDAQKSELGVVKSLTAFKR